MPNPSYPSLPIDHRESRRTLRDGREEDELSDGNMRVRKMHADKFDFEVKHPALTAAQMTTLDNFYATNPSALIDFYWLETNTTYTVRWGKNAIRTQWVSGANGGTRHAWVRLVGTSV